MQNSVVKWLWSKQENSFKNSRCFGFRNRKSTLFLSWKFPSEIKRKCQNRRQNPTKMFTKRLKIYPKSVKKTTSPSLKILINKVCKSNTNAVNTLISSIHLVLRLISTLLKLEISTLLKTITNSCFQALEGLKSNAQPDESNFYVD